MIRSERGSQLVELGMAMAIGALVAALMAVWASGVGRAENQHRAEDMVMQDLRLAKEGLSKDLRRAESFTSTEPSLVTMWVDADRDGTLGVGETISWEITDGGDLVRSVDATEGGVEVADLDVSRSGFGYTHALPGVVSQVSFDLVVLLPRNDAVEERGVAATVHVRNAGT